MKLGWLAFGNVNLDDEMERIGMGMLYRFYAYIVYR